MRAPSQPVLVDGKPWDGSPVADVGFVMMLNDNIVKQQRRVARACVAAGLKVAFINVDMGEGLTPERSDYANLGGPILDLPLGTWRRGVMDFPSPFVLLGKVPKLKALFASSPFTVLAVPIDGWGNCRLLCYWAKTAGVTSLVTQEGMTLALDSEHAPRWERTSGQPLYRAVGTWLVRQIPHDLFKWWVPYSYADFFCAYGEAAKEELAKHRNSESTTFVVGNPSLDHVTQPPSPTPSGRAPRTVLYVQQYIVNQHTEEAFCNELAGICCDENGDRLLIKLHPRSDWTVPQFLSRIVQTSRRTSLLEVVKEGDSNDMLGGVNVLITVNSTTAYHALVAGVPVITLDYLSKGFGRFDASRYGGAIAITNPDPSKLREAIINVTRNEEVRRQLHEGAKRVIERHLYRLDGGASERIAQVLLQLSRGRAPKSSITPSPGERMS